MSKPRGATSLSGATRPRHLLDCWPQVAHSLHHSARFVLFVDFDGTLTPLRERPTDVQPLDRFARGILRRLARHHRVAVNVISGRRLADLGKLIPVRNVRLLGLHGWEGRDVPRLEKERRLMRQARRLLRQRLCHIPKLLLEDKGLGFAVHYRTAPPRSERLARPIVHNTIKTLGSDIHILQGDKVWEILPRQIDGKGSAVRQILAHEPPNTLPIFVGDDVTDERAFAVLPTGLTVCVGQNLRTQARYFLRDPEEVKAFLLRLEVEIAGNCGQSPAV